MKIKIEINLDVELGKRADPTVITERVLRFMDNPDMFAAIAVHATPPSYKTPDNTTIVDVTSCKVTADMSIEENTTRLREFIGRYEPDEKGERDAMVAALIETFPGILT